MESPFDGQKLEIPCGNCGRVLTETVGKLRRNPTLTCLCKTKTDINAKELDSTLKKCERDIKNIFK